MPTPARCAPPRRSSKGHDIVIEGPPGTGKSQTITNLVAQALAAGKSVLFVAEKMAALDVVHRRLVEAGLGEFCLELHSSKANRRAVMKELSAALDASLIPMAGSGSTSKRLPEVRSALSDDVAAVHEPYGELGMSPYAAAGELGRHLDAPKVRLNADIGSVTREQLDAADRALVDLAVHPAAIGDPALHPWRDSGRTLYTEDDLEQVTSIARGVEESVGDRDPSGWCLELAAARRNSAARQGTQAGRASRRSDSEVQRLQRSDIQLLRSEHRGHRAGRRFQRGVPQRVPPAALHFKCVIQTRTQ